MWEARANTGSLVGLCRRLSISLEAGVDVRTVVKREAQSAHGRMRQNLLDISDAIDQGQSLAEAMAPSGEYFPPLLREMVALGEQTGHLDGVLAQLAEHYDNQVKMRRIFLSAIAWPLVQLVLALAVIGLLIWVMGWIRTSEGKAVDILRFGLVGDRGLAIYLSILAAVGAVLFLIVRGISRGLIWTQPIQRLALKIPVLGQALQTMALSRLAWAMHLTMDTGMDVRRALTLSLRSTQNARYTDQIPAIDAEISAGHSIYEAFCSAGGYPAEFLDTLAVGEDSGKIVETMGRLAHQFQDRARSALSVLTLVAGWVVWAAVAGMIIFLIFRLAFFYLNTINDAANMRL
jgi:type II secretory pathway component PulF